MRGLKTAFSLFSPACCRATTLPPMGTRLQTARPSNCRRHGVVSERGVPTILVTIGDASKKLVLNTGSAFSVLSQPAIKEMERNTLSSKGQAVRRRRATIVIRYALHGTRARDRRCRPFGCHQIHGPSQSTRPHGSKADENLCRLASGLRYPAACDADMDFGARKLRAHLSRSLRRQSPAAWTACLLSPSFSSASITFEGVTIENPEINLVPDQLKTRLLNKNRPQTGSPDAQVLDET